MSGNRIDSLNPDLAYVYISRSYHETGEKRMSGDTDIHQIGEFVVRKRNPHGPGQSRLLLLLHGWTGDENSMWIFSSRLPKNYLLLAPRGLVSTPLGGYGWQSTSAQAWPRASDFKPAIDAVIRLVDSIEFPELDLTSFDLMGFSQGAALAYAIALTYPEKIIKIAGLSGFLPEGLDLEISRGALKGKKIFVAHGRQDEIVPVSEARQVVQGLKDANAEIVYCEEDVGHKLSSGCFRGMVAYFTYSE
jgi:phospholipase/carboxylesterase